MPRLIALSLAALLCAPGVGAAAPTDAAESTATRGGPLVVVIDPGHGGARREGAHGMAGLLEKTVALQIALKLKAALEDAGATVLLTREDDTEVPLAARALLANENAADLFLSIHCNSMRRPEDRASTRGVETYFLSPDPTDAEARMLAELENGGPEVMPLPRSDDPVTGILADLTLGQARSDSAALAELVHRHLTHATGAQSRGVRQAPFVVLAGTRMPSALVEIGFISHPQEGRLLASDRYQQRVAVGLAAAVRDFADHVLLRRLDAAVSANPAPARATAKVSVAASSARRAQRAAHPPPPEVPVAAASPAPAPPAPAP
ncbi:MAG TPA: N-acetylmuramoyl-L-alanine amidase, partial [Myxococcales bacterium]|nr:N-acetylmuramoyl-L-alanine amidase [Myxococcales bacterium]